MATVLQEGASQDSVRRRFRFNEELDVALLRACVQRDAHTARYGQTQRAFQDVLRTLESANLLGVGDEGWQRPSWKTLRDRFKHLISDHKAARVRSGIEEAHSEKELLLDDIISMISEEADSMALEREDKMRSLKRLIDAGIELCERGVQRQRKLPRKRGMFKETSRPETYLLQPARDLTA
jgi:hypothetical protein